MPGSPWPSRLTANRCLRWRDGGFVHTSKTRTSHGVAGAISGTMSEWAELIYLDEGVWGVLGQHGDLTIR